MIVISDTSPLTSLTAINQLNLLQNLYQKIIIPQAVYRELTALENPVPGTKEVQILDWIEVKQVINTSLVNFLRQQQLLDAGESEAIALAAELNAQLLLIDERKGRQEAINQGIKITGLLGVLIEAKFRQLIPSVKPLLDDLIMTANFRVSDQLYQQILQITQEK
jgi:predicted nucleic acid-binding protein